MRANELPGDDDGFNLWLWSNVLELGNERPDEWCSPEISQKLTAVVTQEDKGVISLDRLKRIECAWVARGDYAETDMCALAELEDGWATVMAWCDTTGWDCKSGGQWKWAATRDEAIANGLGKEERRDLGLMLPSDEDGAA